MEKSAPASVATVVVTNISGVVRVIKVSKKCQKNLFFSTATKALSYFLIYCVASTLCQKDSSLRQKESAMFTWTQVFVELKDGAENPKVIKCQSYPHS